MNHTLQLRRFFPKGTDFSLLTDRQLQKAVDSINHRPTKILNYRTPAELPAETLVHLDVEFASHPFSSHQCASVIAGEA